MHSKFFLFFLNAYFTLKKNVTSPWSINRRRDSFQKSRLYLCNTHSHTLYSFEYIWLGNSHMVLRSKELLLGELRRNWLCARSAKESKINNQFISPHNTRYSNQQYARFTCILFPSYYFISFFISFSLCPVFFYFYIVLKFVPSHEIHHRVFCPPATAESTFQSNHFKFNIPWFKSIQRIMITHKNENAKTIPPPCFELHEEIFIILCIIIIILYSHRCENGLSTLLILI